MGHWRSAANAVNLNSGQNMSLFGSDPSAAFALGLFLLTGALWLALQWQGTKLLSLLKTKHPREAQLEIPNLFDHWRNPQKAFYIFNRNLRVLFQKDPELRKKRQILLILFFVSLAVPILGIGAIVVCLNVQH